MNLPAIAEALNQNFPGKLAVSVNERGSLTIVVGMKSIDMDSEGNVHNVVEQGVSAPEGQATPDVAPEPVPTETPGV